MRLRRGLILISPLSQERDLQVCGACLQASPRRVLPPLCKGRGTTKWWKGCKNNPPPPAAELPLHKGFASVRSTLAGVAETGSGPRSGWSVVKNNPSPPSAELPLHKGAVKRSFSINRGSAAPLLFDFLSYLLSPRSGLRISNQKKIYLYKGSKHYVHKSASGNSARRAE